MEPTPICDKPDVLDALKGMQQLPSFSKLRALLIKIDLTVNFACIISIAPRGEETGIKCPNHTGYYIDFFGKGESAFKMRMVEEVGGRSSRFTVCNGWNVTKVELEEICEKIKSDCNDDGHVKPGDE